MIHGYLTELRDSINGYYALDVDSALKNSILKQLKDLFDKEYGEIEFEWEAVQNKLNSVKDQKFRR